MKAQIVCFKPPHRPRLTQEQEMWAALRRRGVDTSDFNSRVEGMIKAIFENPETLNRFGSGIQITESGIERWILESCAKDPIQLR